MLTSIQAYCCKCNTSIVDKHSYFKKPTSIGDIVEKVNIFSQVNTTYLRLYILKLYSRRHYRNIVLFFHPLRRHENNKNKIKIIISEDPPIIG